jgi:hypothetical protein
MAEAEECFKRFNPWVCGAAGDAADWAWDVTKWRFGYRGEHDTSDAFRHCAWMGALATRVDARLARGIGFLHEELYPNDRAWYLMDVYNNFVGSKLGQYADNRGDMHDTWGFVLNRCESLARDGRLYGGNAVQGNYKH